MELQERFGAIDIYLFDQLLRGHVSRGMRILDAGCGSGRNIEYLLREGFDVHAVDAHPDAVAAVRRLASDLAPQLASDHFRVEPVEAISFPDGSFDAVISSAVLHFARDDAHFEAMARRMWDLLAPGGLFFARLASLDGMEGLALPIGNGRFHLPDGTDRFLVTADRLVALTETLGGRLVDPIKTTVVHRQRAMATWVAAK